MKTTEVFVEQIFIGFMVLLIGALPFIGIILPETGNATKIIGSALGVAGVAYLLGIPFDRFADTVLSSLEKRNRLRFSIRNPVPDSADPFPEGLLKIAVRQANSGVVSWAEYLRSRIRLSRALAVFTPGLTLSGIVAMWQVPAQSLHGSNAPQWAVIAALGSSCIIYTAAFFWAQIGGNKLPKTEECLNLSEKEESTLRLGVMYDAAARTLVAFVVVGGILIYMSNNWLCGLVGIAGLLITLLSGWSWWRINRTYRKFLADFGRWQELEKR